MREWREPSSTEAVMWLNSKEAEEDMAPQQEESEHNEIFCRTMSVNSKKGTKYMDCTGKFPV